MRSLTHIEQLPKHKVDMWRLTGHFTMEQSRFFIIFFLLDELTKKNFVKSGLWTQDILIISQPL